MRFYDSRLVFLFLIFALMPAASSAATNKYCGVETLSTVYQKFDKDPSLENLFDKASRQYGLTSFDDLINHARSNQLKTFAFKNGSIETIKEAMKQGYVIFNNHGHFSLIEKIDDCAVYIYDPNFTTEHYVYSFELFKRHWDGVGLVLSKKLPQFSKNSSICSLSSREVKKILGANPCSNCSGSGGPGSVYSKGNGANSNHAPSSVGINNASGDTKDPVQTQNGNLFLPVEDINMPARGLPINLTRFYNTQVISEIDGWIPDEGSGSWVVDNGEYSGQGDRSFTKRTWENFRVELDMRTVTPGTIFPWEVGWVNFRYFDANNRYYCLIKMDGTLELARRKALGDNDPPAIIASAPSGTIPNSVNPNHLKIDVTNGNHIRIWVNNALKIDVFDSNPLLGAGYVALESHYSHVRYDNVELLDYSNGHNETYNFTSDDNDFIFGWGWSHSYSMKIKEYADHLTLHRENGGREVYTSSGGGTYSSVPTNTYNDLSKDGSGYTLKDKHGMIHRFDLSGKLLYKEDRNGNRTTLTYATIAGKERPTVIASDGGRQITLQYNSTTGLVESVTDPMGEKLEYFYTANGLLERVEDREGHSTRYFYDPETFNLTELRDKENNPYLYTYVYNDRVSSQKDPLLNVTHFDYNWDTTHVVNDKGEVFKYNYDANLFLQGVEDPFLKLEHTANDANGNIIDHWDKNNRQTHFIYDSKGNVLNIQDAKSQHTAFTYDPVYNFPLTVTNARNFMTTYEYDLKGNLKKITAPAPLNYQTNMIYNSFGQMTTLTDARGKITTFEYTTDGDLWKKHEPGGRDTTFEYYLDGQLKKVINDSGFETIYDYDKNRRLKSVRDPLIQTTNYTYWPNGYLQTATDPLGKITTYTYDPLGNVLTVTDANTGQIVDTHDTDNQLHLAVANNLTVRDQAVHPPTVMTYDKMNRLKTQTDALGAFYEYFYDNQGNLIERRDANNQPNGLKTFYAYDELNRLMDINYPTTNDVHYELDEVGNIKWVDDVLGRTFMEYDALNRLTRVTYPGLANLDYEYDAVGNRTKVTYPSGKIVEYIYNDNNEITQVKDNGVILATYVYDALGRRVRKDLSGTKTKRTLYSYDVANQLVDLVNSASTSFLKGTYITLHDKSLKPIEQIQAGDEVLSFDEATSSLVTALVSEAFEYPAASLNYLRINGKVNVTDTHRFYINPTEGAGGGEWVPANQLQIGDHFLNSELEEEPVTTIDQKQGEEGLMVYDLEIEPTHTYFANGYLVHNPAQFPTFSSFFYQYNAAGNRISMTPFTGGIQNYGYNNIHEVTSVSGGQIHNYLYDLAGNRSSADGINYTTNNANQYSQVGGLNFTYNNNGSMASDGVKTYGYDNENRLNSVTSTSPALNAAYVYDGMGRRIQKTVNGFVTKFVYDGDRVIEERDVNGALVASYVYGVGLDEVLTMDRNSTKYYYFYDGLGSVVNLTNSAGQVQESYSYDAFGNASNVSTLGNPYMFTGQRFDSETGLYYYKARHYNPAIGRFLQRDPIGFADDVNPYRYVKNNPLNYLDPWGLEAEVTNTSGWSNFFHSGLDVAGLIPGYGEIFDLINAGLYYGQGDFINGSLSLSSTIPFIGWGGTVGKFGYNASKQFNKLSAGEIKKLKKYGIDPEQLKGGKSTGKLDLFKDQKGNIHIKPKNGQGPGDPTGININDL